MYMRVKRLRYGNINIIIKKEWKMKGSAYAGNCFSNKKIWKDQSKR